MASNAFSTSGARCCCCCCCPCPLYLCCLCVETVNSSSTSSSMFWCFSASSAFLFLRFFLTITNMIANRIAKRLKPMIRGIPVVWKVVTYFSQMSTSSFGFLHALFHSIMFVYQGVVGSSSGDGLLVDGATEKVRKSSRPL